MKHPRKQSWAPAEAGAACSGLSWEREHFPHGSLGQEPNFTLACPPSGHAVALSWHQGYVCINRVCGPRGGSSEDQLVAPSTFPILQNVSPYASALLVEGLRDLKHLHMSLSH